MKPGRWDCSRRAPGAAWRRPSPGGEPPAGQAPDPDDLPEGGFGWHLIRSLSKDLEYHREGDRNFLTFRLDMRQSEP